MKTVRFFLMGMVLFILLTAVICTRPDYNNPLDTGGTAYVPGDPCAEDDDNDGIANRLDPDGPAECHPKSTPKITLDGDSIIVIPLNDPNGVVTNLKTMVHAQDPIYGNLDTAIVPSGDVFTSQCSTFTITYTVRNIANGIDTKKRVIIVDCEGPEITLKGDNPMNVNVGKPYIEPGATAFDKVSGEAKVTISKPPVTAVEHEDSVIYTAEDAVGNKSRVKRLVIISKLVSNDTTRPVITLIGNSEMTLKIGVGSYNEPGWTVTDNVDADLHDLVQVTGTVNVAKLGTYTIYYNVSDRAGNTAEVKTRIVRITPSDSGPDVTKPEITLLGKTRDSIKVGTTWKEPGYTVWDDRDTVGLGAAVVVTGGPVTTTAETFFRLQYTVKDTAGNTSDVKQRIVVVTNAGPTDTIAPILKLEGKPRDTVAVGTKYTDAGATATDRVPGNPTTLILTNITKIVKNSSGATVQFDQFYKSIGLYSIIYSVKDAAGNPATDVTRSVFVKDTAAIPPDSLFSRYGAPPTKPLPPVRKTYIDTPFVVDGPTATSPRMTSIKELIIAWDTVNGGQLNQFSMSTRGGTFIDLKTGKFSQTFKSNEPKFTISGTNISKLDGEYYLIVETKRCVWVRTDGSFAIIFK